ncbi:hypothetical protein [Rhodohalobacter sp.]|uniref:hypothetical protein n=1 Tax=Rhodohalobacter sp. TaxID=1974210 RepID=UPI00356B5F1A
MPLIDRSDLKYDYNWSTEPAKEPRTEATTQTPSNPNIFRPKEGNKVLDFINDYAESRNISEKEKARNLEPLLQKRLEKDDGVTQEELEEWLDKEREQ